jgi:two-component system cell cycle sensor histidine kinase PleC
VLIDQDYGPLNEKQKNYLGDVLTSGQQLLSLINAVLDISRFEAGEMKLELAAFSLKQLLEQSFLLVKEKAIKHNISISLEIPDEIGEINADERKIKLVVFNLLSNAVKFTPDGGRTGIRARKDGDRVEVSVWDTGFGISIEDQPKIFNKLTQLGDPYTGKSKGAGLGLAMAKNMVELHGGKIWVESEGKDKGSIFKFTLPVTQKDKEKAE